MLQQPPISLEGGKDQLFVRLQLLVAVLEHPGVGSQPAEEASSQLRVAAERLGNMLVRHDGACTGSCSYLAVRLNLLGGVSVCFPVCFQRLHDDFLVRTELLGHKVYGGPVRSDRCKDDLTVVLELLRCEAQLHSHPLHCFQHECAISLLLLCGLLEHSDLGHGHVPLPKVLELHGRVLALVVQAVLLPGVLLLVIGVDLLQGWLGGGLALRHSAGKMSPK
mmetsp:Transcript_34154/g.79369  ORF Transcript_34154/g.79369 Transcript_34154/m.79369 type:complete len:221 (+) Transcript_34154:696-1358(+)